jgi:hypothetical protein
MRAFAAFAGAPRPGAVTRPSSPSFFGARYRLISSARYLLISGTRFQEKRWAGHAWIRRL